MTAFYDEISVSSAAGTITSSTNDDVVGFSNFEIENLLDEINLIPGKIEAEFYEEQFGIGTEDTTDTGLGLNIKDLPIAKQLEDAVKRNESTYDDVLGNIEFSRDALK